MVKARRPVSWLALWSDGSLKADIRRQLSQWRREIISFVGGRYYDTDAEVFGPSHTGQRRPCSGQQMCVWRAVHSTCSDLGHFTPVGSPGPLSLANNDDDNDNNTDNNDDDNNKVASLIQGILPANWIHIREFCSCDLGFDPMTLKILKTCLHTKNKLFRTKLSKVRTLETDRQTERQTDRCDWNITTPHSRWW